MKLFNKNKTKKILLTKVGNGSSVPVIELYKMRRQKKKENKTVTLETIIMLLLATMFSWGTSEIQLFGNNATVYLCVLAGIAILCIAHAIVRYNRIASFYRRKMKRMSVPIITFNEEDEGIMNEVEDELQFINISRTASKTRSAQVANFKF